MGGEALLVEGVTVDVGRGARSQRLLADVSLAVPAGRTLALLGSSGAGKTTLLRVIAGLTRPTAGSVTLGERVLTDGARHVAPERRRIGMVFQALELWPHLTLAEHVAFGLPERPRGRRAAADERVRAWLAHVGLEGADPERTPASLSGGERQRLAIARALAPEPAVVLFDEPLASLDPERRRRLRALLRRLARDRDVTAVYVTHDPDEALEMADEIAVIDRGRILERGAAGAMYSAPHTVAGARALGPATVLAGAVEDDRVLTALGALVPATRPTGRRARIVLRPEDVVPAAGAPDGTAGQAAAVVVDVHRRTAGYGFEAELDGERIWGTSAAPPEVGTSLALAVVGTPALLGDEGSEA